jgi:hypothetical protein
MGIQVQGTAAVNGTVTCMARIVGHSGEAITLADIAAIAYTIYLIPDPPASGERAAVDGHEAVAVAVADAMLAALTVPAAWTDDSTGVNFLHTIPIVSAPAFALPRRQYAVDYTLTPTSGQPIVASFLVRTLH